MAPIAILWPVFVQVALTYALIVWMGLERGGALKRKDVHISDIALGERAWPERTTQIGNAFHNQLQLPILFYVLVAMVLATNQVDIVLVVLAWLFAGLRLVHAYIHTSDNYVPRRAQVFFAGAVVLLVMWIVFAVRMAAA